MLMGKGEVYLKVEKEGCVYEIYRGEGNKRIKMEVVLDGSETFV